ncbi:MAG: hypothetical protein ACR2RF_12250 [Geminicoccaceae bacterium]
MKQFKGFYPIDWQELSRVIRFERAKGRCERCGRPHGQVISHLGDGRWFDPERDLWRDGEGRAVAWIAFSDYRGRLRQTKVILATAHLDHDPGNNRTRNLRALCQRCHLHHDRSEHRRRRRVTYRKRRALGDLFDGPYPR